MRVKKLLLKKFRNMDHTTFNPGPRVNFLFGQNGHGKTTVLEALAYLATLRSFRSSRATETVQWGNQTAELHCEIYPESNHDWNTQLKMRFSFQNHPSREKIEKLFTINGKPYKSTAQYLKQRFATVELGFHTITFNPSDHDLVRGEPQIRRSYLDSVIAAETPEYYSLVLSYRRILDQRNVLLKNREAAFFHQQWLGFTGPFCDLAAKIVHHRLNWCHRLNKIINCNLKRIEPSSTRTEIRYQDGLVVPLHDYSIEFLKQVYQKRIQERESAELALGYTLVGPHREDWAFYFGDQPLRGHGSQGEVRSTLLALKLSEIELFRERTGHCPVFLLDDFSSELDQNRRSFLLRFLMDTDLQVFVTTTDDTIQSTNSLGSRFKVQNGTLLES